MITKSGITSNLNSLNSRYKKAGSPKEALFFSKLAILELCGWIEESMDDIVRTCAKGCLKNTKNYSYIQNTVILRNYGFDYEKHFRKMLVQVIGLVNIERIESKADATKHAKLMSTLSALKKARDTEAHTHIKGITKSINAPSVTKTQFKDIYDGLIDIDKIIRSMRF